MEPASHHSSATERDKAQWQLLTVANTDLQQANFYANHLLKKSWHGDLGRRRWSTYLQITAYTTALVVAYSRPFTQARGWPKFPTKLLNHNSHEKILHSKILRLRNEVYAHSDIGIQNVRKFSFMGEPLAIMQQPHMMLPPDEIAMIVTMTKDVMKQISQRRKELAKNFPDEA